MPSLIPHNLVLATVIALSALTSVTALSIPTALAPRAEPGINCDGSSQCGMNGRKGLSLFPIINKINKIPQNTTLLEGAQLACSVYEGIQDFSGNLISDGSGICASVCHNTPSILIGPSTNGKLNSAADVIGDLIDHGCEACGTAPYVRQGNMLSKGCISVNYVSQVCYSVNDQPCLCALGQEGPDGGC